MIQHRHRIPIRCRQAARVVLLAWAFVFAAACSAKSPGIALDGSATGDAEVEGIYQDARANFESGNIGEADEGFARIIREFPKDPLVRSAIIYRARIALKLDNPKRARNLLAPIKGTDDPTAERALLYDGWALEQMGRNAEAIRVLEPLAARLTNLEDIQVLENALWNAARKSGKISLAAQSVERLSARIKDAREKRELLRSFKRALVPVTNVQTLEKLAKELPTGGAVKPIVEGRIAELYLESGNFQKAQEILDRLDRTSPTEEPEGSTAGTVPEDLDTGIVGLLVPLSGRARLVGDSALKGATLAAQEAGVRLVVRDSKSSPEEAAAAVVGLVEKDRAAIIVGPLDAATAEAAAQKAQALGVPILTLSIREEITAVGDYVFREFAGNRAEPSALLDIADARGARRCGVLFPENGYGRVMRALFAAAIADRNLTLAGEVSYPENAVNFKEQAEKLAEQDLDVLFIPDRASKIALIAPALAAAGIWSSRADETIEPPDGGAAVQIIVPSIGFSDDLIRRAGRYLNGALFSVFFAPEVHPSSQAFAKRYNLEYGVRANMLSAYGHDAVLIAGRAVKSGIQSRSDLRHWLIENAADAAPHLNTAAPFEGFTENGAPKAAPHIVELSGAQFTILNSNEK